MLIEVCNHVEQSHGWRAGFVERSQSSASGMSELLKEGKPSLIVLDYAESRTSEIVEITKTALRMPNAPPVRLVLLAREGGDWWDRLADGAGSDQAVSAILRGHVSKTGPYRMTEERIDRDDRGTIFGEAFHDFAESKGMTPPPMSPPDLSDDLFGSPFFIHLSALSHLRGQPSIDDKELLGMALGHERSYWWQLLREDGLLELEPALEQAVALLTLCGDKRTAKEARAVLAKTPRLRELGPATPVKLFDVLRRLYPVEGGLAGLQPDVLGETLVGEALAQDDELLDVAFGPESSREDIRHALTVLTRLGHRVPSEQRWLKNALARNLTKISEDALQVGVETGGPLPEIHAQVLRVAAPQERRRAVDILRMRLPGTTLNLANLNIEIRRQAVAFLENKKTGSPAKRHSALSAALPLLATALRDKGLLDEAAEVAAEAVRHASLAFRSDKEDDRRRLASVLGNVDGHLSRVGRFEEALTAAEKAESLRRGLAEKQPDAYTPDWATSLSNLGGHLRDVGRFEEALTAAEKAESLRRGLAEKQPDAYTPDWATSLGNLADSQLAVGEFATALETAKTASFQISAFAGRYPPVYNPWLGFARRIAAESYFKMGSLDEALAEARLSVQIWTEVATARQNYESTQVAKTFRALMQCEIALNQNESAIETLKRGLSLLHIPLKINPKPLQPIISELVNLALAIDVDAVARVIPIELRRVLSN